jgi:hypothetical protein
VSYVGIVSQHQQHESPQTRRRPPRFSAFLGTGAVLGLLAGLLLSAMTPADPRYDATATWGFFGLVCAGLGLLLGGVVAVLIDRRS